MGLDACTTTAQHNPTSICVHVWVYVCMCDYVQVGVYVNTGEHMYMKVYDIYLGVSVYVCRLMFVCRLYCVCMASLLGSS